MNFSTMCSILVEMKLLHWQISIHRSNRHILRKLFMNYKENLNFLNKKVELTLVLNFLFLNVALIKHIFSFGTSIFCFRFFGSLFKSTRHKNKNIQILIKF